MYVVLCHLGLFALCSDVYPSPPVFLNEYGGQSALRSLFPIYHPYLNWPVPHSSHKLNQPFLIRMCRIAANAGDTGFYIQPLAINIDITTYRAIA